MNRILMVLAAMAAMAALTVGGGVQAQAPAAPAAPAAGVPLEVYGRLPGLEQVVLSPDGTKLAYITVVGDSRRMNVITLGGQALAAVGLGDQKVRDIMWGDNDHIVITTSVTGRLCGACDKVELYGAQSFSISRRTFVQLMKDIPGTAGSYIAGPPYVRRVNGKDIVLVAAWLDDAQDYRRVQFNVNLDTGQARLYDFNFGVMNDQGGIVAATEHYTDRGGRWRLVTGSGNGLRELFVQDRVGLDPPELLGYGRSTATVLLKVLEGDEWRYYEIDLVSGAKTRFDMPVGAGALHDPRTDRLLGVGGLTGNEWSYNFDDPALKAGWAKVAKAFAGKNPTIVSWTPDFTKAIILTSGPAETGTYYLMDFAANRATPIGSQYPQVRPEQVNPTTFITYKAGDGLDIPAYLTLPAGRDPKGLPLIVMPHGGPQARDEPGFDWWAQALASRGYAVLQPQFRGSDGFGVVHTRAGYGQWGRLMQTDLSDGVRFLAGQGTVDPAKVCIVGASYGGYAAMAGVSLNPGVYRCAVSVAGVSDMRKFLAWKKEEEGGANTLGVRFWRRYLGTDQGGDAVLAQVSPLQNADRFYAPILLIHGRDDTIVPYDQSEALAKALKRAGKPVEMITLQGEDHFLSRGATRLQMLQATVVFLEKHNPPR